MDTTARRSPDQPPPPLIWRGPLNRGSTLGERARQLDAAAARMARVAPSLTPDDAFRLGRCARRYTEKADALRRFGGQ